MPLLTDEPLIDDSELDDFDWDACLASSHQPQPLTWRGNIMKSYHLFMHTTALALSAVLFKGASAVLGAAVTHKQKLDRLRDKERTRSFGYHGSNAGSGVHFFDEFTPDEDEFLAAHVAYGNALAGDSKNKWVDAEPCSDFDPIHPDYVPYLEK